MSALARPALCVQLLLLSAGAGAFCVTPLSQRSVRCLATERQALGMNAGADSPIPELAALYEVMPLMTYDGWECDAEIVEDCWVSGGTSASIKERVAQMRRKQCLHEGDRSDALLQVLDGATQGFTYPGWELDHEMAEDDWAEGFVAAASIKERVEQMRRKQCLHEGDRSDALLQVLDGATQGLTYPGWELDHEMVEDDWAEGFVTAASIKQRVEQMRRKQRVHDSHKKSPTMKPPAIPAVWKSACFTSAYFFLVTWCFYVWYTHTVGPIFS